MQSRRIAAGIIETDILKADPVFWVRPLSLVTGLLGYFVFQILGEGRQVEIIFVHAIDRAEAIGHCSLAQTKLSDIHSHLTDGDSSRERRESHPAISEVKCGTGQQPQYITPQPATDDQISVFFIYVLENIGITLKKQFAQLKQFDFFHSVFARQNQFEIELHAAFRRPAPK